MRKYNKQQKEYMNPKAILSALEDQETKMEADY